MRIIFLGPPGSGKGTQAFLIAKKYNIANISTGIMLKEELQKKSFKSPVVVAHHRTIDTINSGNLIDDEFVIQLIITRINQADCYNGFILDGFPRTITQALSMNKHQISINFIIQFILPDSVIINRISGRLIHPASGRIYHNILNPPKHYNVDDITGEILVKRADDSKNAIRTRLNKYYQYTEPLINYYKQESMKKTIHYVSVDGNRKINEIYKELIDIIHM